MIWVPGLVALCGQVGEGSAGDWSAVYLHVNLGTAPGVAAVGLGAFSVTMAAGRVAGDRLADGRQNRVFSGSTPRMRS